jgi:hypothetical protein
MGPKRLRICLIVLSSAVGFAANAATLNYNFTGSYTGVPLGGAFGLNGKTEFGVFDVDGLFWLPQNNLLQMFDPNNGNWETSITNNSSSEAASNNNTNTGLFNPNGHLTLTGMNSGNGSNTALDSPAIPFSTPSFANSAHLTVAQNTTGLSGTANSAKPSSMTKGSAAIADVASLSLPLLLSDPSAPSTGSVASTDTSRTSSSVSTAPLPDAFSLFATGLGGLALLYWRRKRKVQSRI